MNCSDVAKVLQSYIDGEISADIASKVAVHLDGCNGCCIDRDNYQQIKASLSHLRRNLDPEATERIVNFIERIDAQAGD